MSIIQKLEPSEIWAIAQREKDYIQTNCEAKASQVKSRNGEVLCLHFGLTTTRTEPVSDFDDDGFYFYLEFDSSNGFMSGFNGLFLA